MVACNTDGTVVIVGSILMVVRNSHQRGKKEEQYKKTCKSPVTAYGASFEHKHRLAFAGQLVKRSFAFVPTLSEASSLPSLIRKKIKDL
jgi:hypothetical protein